MGRAELPNSFDLMLNAYEVALSRGCNIEQFLVVGGAGHGRKWSQRLEETCGFFESCLTIAEAEAIDGKSATTTAH
ncbi:MAG: hypothetical protein E6933_12270 [Clostridiales bacterium]|uniref:Uncharacterized protein n=1 Tax=Intestinimonas massiliensis (ex Afouda et al. 2020) TaxID=1673721 RepID=A0AAW5JLM6_9FIRM|nr:hypothetical protein [Intestinimonas massiliensis (ex Afouda et al. 2020)]MCG4528503.1 hypothetical protein [Intestinimonas massiliensis (ex Afouda et al. 2020)]MCQ4770733.1 hypothetical protein [Intestinimonas massiliensis (ex Afouda et al. 2020)]MCQ4806726.1 hypothetical protein [Intestinimonas massiliensis (ex Afouda et al. 2020)]MDU1325955.1 hypothetical protein [Clostridiales bacterium]